MDLYESQIKMIVRFPTGIFSCLAVKPVKNLGMCRYISCCICWCYYKLVNFFWDFSLRV